MEQGHKPTGLEEGATQPFAEQRTLQFDGGAVNEEHCVYVRRAEDDRAYYLLGSGQPCALLSPRQYGKTSLIMWCARRFLEREDGPMVAIVDLSGAIGGPSDPNEWFIAVLGRIAKELGFSRESARSYWQGSSAPAADRLVTFFRDHVAAVNSQPAVIFIDEIDKTRFLPYTRAFFEALKLMYDARARDPLLRRVTWCISGSATVAELVGTDSAEELGPIIELKDFSAREHDLSEVATALSTTPEDGGQKLERVLNWTNGHPYLTSLLGNAVSRAPTENIDSIASGLFSREPTENGVKVHFREIRVRAGQPGPLAAYRRILESGSGVDVSHADLEQLRLSGLIVTRAEGVCIRNRIYERCFDVGWVEEVSRDIQRGDVPS